jgi:hypothetical protein
MTTYHVDSTMFLTSLIVLIFQLTLDFLCDRLAEAHTDHLDRGCRLKPTFCIKTEFNLTALYIMCEGCNTFEVVI